MEDTATAILAGLGTMLVVAAVVAGLVWLSHRLADRARSPAAASQAPRATPGVRGTAIRGMVGP